MLSFRFVGACAMIALASLMFLVAPARSLAAGAFAMGKCGAYGQAYDFQVESDARAAALKKCRASALRSPSNALAPRFRST